MDFSDFYKLYNAFRSPYPFDKKEAKRQYKEYEKLVKAIEKKRVSWYSPEDIRQMAEIYGDMVKIAQHLRQNSGMPKYQQKAMRAYQQADRVEEAIGKAMDGVQLPPDVTGSAFGKVTFEFDDDEKE